MADREDDGVVANDACSGPSSRHHRRSGFVGRFHTAYDPAELARAIHEIRASGSGSTDDNSWDAAPTSHNLTSEDAHRLRVLERIGSDRRGHQRRSIVGSSAMARRIEALSAAMPHFAPAIDLVARAALVSSRTATPLRLPPVLLLGQPGIGKSYALRRLAQAIGADFSLIAANLTDPFRLRGMGPSWRGAKPGLVAEILLGSSTAPVVLVDEFDKAVGGHLERPYDVWHSLLERENARHYKDDYLEIELRADQVTWFASANDVSALPASIVDRLLIIEVPAPSPEQIAAIIASIYAACRAALGSTLPETLSESVAAELGRHNPRCAGRLLELAIGYAAAAGRRAVSTDDVRNAHRLADLRGSGGFRGSIGFTPSLMR